MVGTSIVKEGKSNGWHPSQRENNLYQLEGCFITGLWWTTWTTDEGTIYVAATEEGLCYVSAPGESWEELSRWVERQLPSAQLLEDDERFKPYLRQLNEYMRGVRQHFSVPVRLFGTPFQRLVWEALDHIPYGQT